MPFDPQKPKKPRRRGLYSHMVGTSKMANKRKRKASLLSRLWRLGDAQAGFRLSRRQSAYLSLMTGMPWQERLRLAAIGSAKHNAEKRLLKAKQEAQRAFEESTRDL